MRDQSPQSSSSGGSGYEDDTGIEEGSESEAASQRSDENDLDPETNELLLDTPLCGRIGEFMELHFRTLPQEVVAWFASRSAGVSTSRCLKHSFHTTFLVELNPRLRLAGKESVDAAIVQVIGCQLGDKALFGPMGAGTLVKAAELAASAGVRVPRIFGSGECGSHLGPLDFVVEEFIESETVEDVVRAPPEHWQRIAGRVRSALGTYALEGVDVSPLPTFDSLSTYLQWLMLLAPAWDDKLAAALVEFTQEALLSAPPACGMQRLIHQDINWGNLLCSQRRGPSWDLDAVIDWESAAVTDPRLCTADEPWQTARMFGLLVKGVDLASRFVNNTLPRCELEQLVQGYDSAARFLDCSCWLPYQSWSVRVKRAREAGVC